MKRVGRKSVMPSRLSQLSKWPGSVGITASLLMLTPGLGLPTMEARELAPTESGPIGTFLFIDKDIAKTRFYMVVQAESRRNLIQVTGRSHIGGKPTADLTGTYYPERNEFRGTARQLSGTRSTENYDGRYIAETQSFEFWVTGARAAKFFAKRVDLAEVEGDYVSSGLYVSIRKQGTGYGVTGKYGDYSIKGSYLPKSGEVAAKVGGMTLDGVFDPYSKGLYLWLSPASGAVSADPAIFAGRGTLPPSAFSSDPAVAPGAIWSQRETYRSEISGTWTLDSSGRRFKAEWSNGAVATLTLETFTASDVVVKRDDLQGTSKGLRATYRGKRNGRHVSGDVEWIWSDGKRGKGKWSADLP